MTTTAIIATVATVAAVAAGVVLVVWVRSRKSGKPGELPLRIPGLRNKLGCNRDHLDRTSTEQTTWQK